MRINYGRIFFNNNSAMKINEHEKVEKLKVKSPIMTKSNIDDFNALWRTSETDKMSYSQLSWEERAKTWISEFISEGAGKPWTIRRVAEIAAYLRRRNIIDNESSIADVGCGAGLFVMEFGKTAQYALGLDYSSNFIQYGRNVAKMQGIHNVEFRTCDFDNADIDEMGLSGKFDLAFSYITPAIFSLESVKKLMQLSHSWCFNAGFVSIRDSVVELICKDVFHEKYTSHRNGTGFYCLFNILWLMGYHPETSYYVEKHTEKITPTLENANDLAGRCHHKTAEDVDKILDWLKIQGDIDRKVEYTYGGILWDIRVKEERI
jgi:SAM-dependent methyltransferase